MINFKCSCGNTLYFENTKCVNCDKELGFVPTKLALSPIERSPDGVYVASAFPERPSFRLCRNYSEHHICNWLVPESDESPYCLSCRFTSVIPNLDVPGNLEKWAGIAAAKRRLFFTLIRLGLPLHTKAEDAKNGLEFRLLADASEPGKKSPQIFTGHADGVITLNIIEADDAAREHVRLAMHEPYRTLLGHLRHEIGHYYWMLLVQGGKSEEDFKALFGDPSIDYSQSLQSYHNEGPATNWAQRFVSAYASSHPWEDWAETWAHYLHIYDTLETAWDLGLKGRSLRIADKPHHPLPPFDDMMKEWASLSVVLNCMNRSLGLRDAYPFVLAPSVIEKLRFIHQLINESTSSESSRAPSAAHSSLSPPDRALIERSL